MVFVASAWFLKLLATNGAKVIGQRDGNPQQEDLSWMVVSLNPGVGNGFVLEKTSKKCSSGGNSIFCDSCIMYQFSNLFK